MEIKTTDLTVDGVPVRIYTLQSASGLTLRVTNLGAAALAICLPDGTDVLLGFRSLERQLEKGPMFGATLGRCAGKLLGGTYVHNGETVALSQSHGLHHAHGGVRGFDKRAFETVHAEADAVTFRYCSPDGEEGYPGDLTLWVTYRLSWDTVELRYEASANADTPVCISNHMYFNLYGHGAGHADAQRLAIHAAAAAGLDGSGLSDGRTLPVAGTPMDLNRPVRLDACLEQPSPQMALAGGFDHDYLLDGAAGPAAVLEAPGTGRSMELETSLPCIHFYLCDLGAAAYPGKDGAGYTGRCGLCLEPMYPSDSLHNGLGPSPMLPAGTPWRQYTRLRFRWNGEAQESGIASEEE